MTMFRYVIIIWNINNASECDAVHKIRRQIRNSPAGWRSALDCPGMYVAFIDEHPSDTVILVADSRGVILGEIFKSPGSFYSIPPTPIRFVSRGDSEEILRSKGRSLISNCWGYIVVALH
jgi:hypothetical protein